LGLKGFADCGADCLDCPRGRLSQEMLELCEDLLDWIQVWRVFGQEEQLGAGRTDELSHRPAFVAAEVIHDHDVAGTKRWDEHLFDIEAEALAVDRTLEQPRRVDAVVTQCRQESHGLPAAVRHLADEPLAACRPAAQWSHIGSGPGLVDEDKPLRIDVFLIFGPLCASPRDVRTVAFASHHAFF
jgi:hypothetical protein